MHPPRHELQSSDSIEFLKYTKCHFFEKLNTTFDSFA
jgi:hypothetical protein